MNAAIDGVSHAIHPNPALGGAARTASPKVRTTASRVLAWDQPIRHRWCTNCRICIATGAFESSNAT